MRIAVEQLRLLHYHNDSIVNLGGCQLSEHLSLCGMKRHGPDGCFFKTHPDRNQNSSESFVQSSKEKTYENPFRDRIPHAGQDDKCICG